MFFYVHFWAWLSYNLWALREIAEQNSHHIWSNANVLWLNILPKNFGFVPPFGFWCNQRHSWILPLHEHKPSGASWGIFFQSFFAGTDRGQRNGDRCHCSGGAMSSQLHLVTLSQSCREFLTAQKELLCSSQHQDSQNKERIGLFEPCSLPQPM